MIEYICSNPALGRASAARRSRGFETLPKLVASRFRNRLATSRSEEHTSELQSLMRISYAFSHLKKYNTTTYLESHLQSDKNKHICHRHITTESTSNSTALLYR